MLLAPGEIRWGSARSAPREAASRPSGPFHFSLIGVSVSSAAQQDTQLLERAQWKQETQILSPLQRFQNDLSLVMRAHLALLPCR